MRPSHLRLFLVVAVALTALSIPRGTTAQANQLCFDVPGISNCVEGRFREYWVQNGGLPVFGYPISPATMQQTAEGTFLTQYFERNRFELHPETARPYDVLLGRLGDDRLKQQGRDWNAFAKADPSAPHYFSQTAHAIAHSPFWAYWSSHGLEFDGQRGTSFGESLALFGLPLSEPQVETNSSGDTVTTQWFERARFEDHGARGVLLGLLGNETGGSGPGPVPAPAPAPVPGPAAPAGLHIAASGFGQSERRVGYGFILFNNQARPVENVEYQVAFYDAAGNVVDTDSSFVEIVYANERLGVADNVIVDEGARVARVAVQINPGGLPSDFVSLGANPLKGENAIYRPDRYTANVTGTVRNSLGRTITNVRVHAITYDASGNINGGGATYLDFVPQNGTTAVKVYVEGVANVAKVELYAALTILSRVGD